MPSYFYHLALELYPVPKSVATEPSGPAQIYIPPPGVNIFSARLPAHKITPWRAPPSELSSTEKAVSDPASALTKHSQHAGVSNLPLRPSSSATSGVDTRAPAAPPSSSPFHWAVRDWRYDSVTIQSIDMVPDPTQIGNGKEDKPHNRTPATTSSREGSTRAKFVPSDPKDTEVGWGVIHLYRDAQDTPDLDNQFSKSSDKPRAFKEEDCTTLCILAVPSYMTTSDILGFLGEQTREDVSHFRLLRTGRANKYMVLMKFKQAKKARVWKKEWNGKLFNIMEPETCQVVFVQSITFQTEGQHQHPSSFPNMPNDPFIPTSKSTASVSEPSALAAALNAKPLAPPTPSLVELPTCPVCLELMDDESSGLLTILCQHVFHCACLEKWRGSGCPVCRYTQTGGFPGLTCALDESECACSVCGGNGNLWVCLICGNVGCGRYDSAHAFAHWEETGHSFAMDITTQHVWDYAGDGYVHRIITNKTDGKLVHLSAAWANNGARGAGGESAGSDMVPREKMDAMSTEYTYLLTSQLESQRLYFEEQMERAVSKASKASAAAESAAASLEKITQQLNQLQTQHAEAQGTIAILQKEFERANRKAEKSDALARKLTKDWKEEKTMNEALMEKIRFLNEKLSEGGRRRDELEAEKRDLEEQNRDLTFFISGSEKLKEAGDDIVEGTIEVPVAEAQDTGKKRKGKGKR
ncbi:zf-UBP-domain-containing protein [Trichodelitschia bisporula]|uniref:Zf-UBP-domain-containing protein n=1 Tax=Trichodelitschia bisporula TaxID=703511 RepID=A0A6G1HYV8_9PEZI|nr:zf-UBP-domain-containing protein [Trichodelitschia bisporula]